MKKFINKNFWQETFIGTFFLFAIEIIFRIVSKFTILDWATLRILISSFCIVLLFEIILSFLKKRQLREKWFCLMLFIVTCYAWAQMGLRNFLGVYMSLGTSSQIGAVTSYIKEFLISMQPSFYLIFIPLILYFIFLASKKKWDKVEGKISWQPKLLGLFVFVFSAAFYMGTLNWSFMQNPIQSVANSILFVSPTNPSIAMNQFGPSVFGILDIKQLLFPKYIIVDPIHGTEQEKNESSIGIDDDLWTQISEEEKDAVYKSLHQYFLSLPVAKTNEYTGYFEGKNVIVIMLESINDAFLNPEYFPNFNQMLEHSWYWENNYSPRNSCATGDNEFSGMTSIYALNSSCTANTYQNNKNFSAIFNRFLDAQYSTSSFHNLDSTYYARDVFHLNLGSQKYYDGNSLGISFDSNNFVEWPSDVELMEKAASIFTQSTPFMTWITTVSAHQPYDSSSVLGDKYLSLFDNTDYPLTLKRYLSKAKVTDDALGVLLEELESKKMLEDTVIVMYGDHYPYGLMDEDIGLALDFDMKEFYERERVPFVIYNSELEPKVFNEKTSYMNILPTLANLFGLNYDSRLYFGEDLFSDTFSNRVVFADSSWEDAIARYDAGSSTITYFGEEKYSDAELQKINNEIYQKKQMSRLAVSSNYYEYLETKLNEKRLSGSNVTTKEE